MNKLYCGKAIKSQSPFWDIYIYVDTPEHLADNLFNKKGVKVHHLRELYHPERYFHVLICKVWKRNSAKFRDALLELQDKMLICGHADFKEACEVALDIETEMMS